MIQSVLYKTCLSMVFLTVCFASSFAGEGDDKDKEKEVSKSNDSTQIVSKDSVPFYTGVNQADDTLVFEDWDLPDGDKKGGNEISIVGGAGLNSGNKKSMLDLAMETGIKNIKAERYKVEFVMYPNPVVERISIQAEVPAQSIRIIDLLGNTMKEIPYENSINVVDLPVGTYFIQLMYSDHTESRKFIKVN